MNKLFKYFLIGALVIPAAALAAIVPYRTQTIRAQVLTSKEFEPPVDGFSHFMICLNSKLCRVEIVSHEAPNRGKMVNIMRKQSLLCDYYYYLD